MLQASVARHEWRKPAHHGPGGRDTACIVPGLDVERQHLLVELIKLYEARPLHILVLEKLVSGFWGALADGAATRFRVHRAHA